MLHTIHRRLPPIGTGLLVVVFLTGAFLAGEALSQTATMRGFIVDDAGGEALQGVNVILRSPAGEVIGTATDSEGFYIVTSIAPGTYYFQASFIGFIAETDTLLLAPGETLTRSIRLQVDRTELGELVVEAERSRQPASVTAGLQSVSPQDIELIPAPDVSADLVNYITTMPGVVATGDRGGKLFIRGGEPTQNLVQLDGMLVYQPFHIVGFYSAFPADLVRNADIYAGGFGAKFGGRLSSVVDISTRNGNKRRFNAAATLAPFVSSARIEGPLARDRVSVILSARQSVIDQGAAKLIDEPLPFRFGDQFAKIHASLSSSSQLSTTVIRTTDRGVVGLDEGTADLDSPTTDQVKWENLAFGTRFIVLPSTLPVFAEILLSASQLDQSFGPKDDPVRSSDIFMFNGSANVTYFTPSVDVHWGLFLQSSELKSNLGGQFQNVANEEEYVTEAGLYAEPEIRVTSNLIVRPGVRLHSFPSKSKTFLEPRFRIIYNRGIHQLSGAFGQYHQEVVGLNDRRDAGDIFTAWTSAPLGLVPEAIHAIAGYKLSPGSGVDLSVEGFWKKLSDLSVPEWTGFPRLTIKVQPADGTAYGADVRFGIDRNWFFGFVSYGYSFVEYEARGDVVPQWFGLVSKYSPPHDRRHQVSAVASVEYQGFELSLRWQYGSGLPFSQSIGFDRFILINGQNNVREDPGSARVLYGPPYDGRLPDYHRFDVSLERAFDFRNASLTLQAALINAYDRSNLFYMDLFTLDRVDQLPLIPSVGIKVEVN
ncbi:MAG: TonB-dependent receptor [Rhodothermia bacterium]|nr:TonB-dependent receptor [Rhodothermia bacterium]